MSEPGTETPKFRLRAALFAQQNGLCFWCRLPMTPTIRVPKGVATAADMCTLDHLDPMWSPDRDTFAEPRLVAACYQCNQARNTREIRLIPQWLRDLAHTQGVPISELRRIHADVLRPIFACQHPGTPTEKPVKFTFAPRLREAKDIGRPRRRRLPYPPQERPEGYPDPPPGWKKSYIETGGRLVVVFVPA